MTEAEKRLREFIDIHDLTGDVLVYGSDKKTFIVQDDIETILNMIEEARKRCKQEISASSIQYERNKKQIHWTYKVAHERILELLGESYETCKK